MEQYIFQMIVVLLGALSASSCALYYFQRVRLERPPIGTFNSRDILILLVFIVSLPILYLYLPGIVLTSFLVLTFISALYLGLTPLLRRRYVWLIIAALLGADIYIALNFLGLQIGWQVYWAVTSTVVLIAAVSVSNLYVQGGLRLRTIAWFALILGFYDLTFTTLIPLTPLLADRFIGHPLDPSMGFRMGIMSANIGLGDLLIYSLFLVGAYKGYGAKAAGITLAVIAIFGAIVPAWAPLVLTSFIRGSVGIVFPAQASFGPVAFLTYLCFRKAWGPERSMAEWFKVQAAMGHKIIRAASATARRAPAPAAPLPRSAEIITPDVQGTD